MLCPNCSVLLLLPPPLPLLLLPPPDPDHPDLNGQTNRPLSFLLTLLSSDATHVACLLPSLLFA
jgi:hypothetical protein